MLVLKRYSFLLLIAVGSGGLSLSPGCGHQGPTPSVALETLDGKTVDPFQTGDFAINVFLFTRSDCPIANRYAPRVQSLHARFLPRKVAFWLVYADPDERSESIRKHVREYELPGKILVDREHELVDLTGVQVTPEVAVFNAGEMVYRGRIDDRYTGFGTARVAPSQHDFADALEATLQGKAVSNPRTTAVGCFIADLRR